MRLRSDRYGTPTARNTHSGGKSEASDLRGAGSVHRRQGQMFFDDSLSPGAQAVYGGRNEFRRNPPLRRGDGEQVPFAGHALELVSAAVFELEP